MFDDARNRSLPGPRRQSTRLSLCTLLLVIISGAIHAERNFTYLFPRTLYVDHLLLAGGWWANPALLGDVGEAMVVTANALPLGSRLLISDTRLLLPLQEGMTLGASILGAGDYQPGSSNSAVDGGGFSYGSSFAFRRPRFQIGAGLALPFVGSVGAFFSGGADVIDGQSQQLSFSPGFCLGWLSPRLGIPLQLSSSWMFIHHNANTAYWRPWESSMKIGLRWQSADSAFSACGEYTVTLSDAGFGVLTPEKATYDVVKALLAVRLYRSWAGIAGISSDLHHPLRNGTCLHVGAEVQPAEDTPFFAGYDLGWQLSYDPLFLHHIWFGLKLGRLKKT
jgi:hypothetical protein